MKKLILLLGLLAITLTISAQNPELEKWKEATQPSQYGTNIPAKKKSAIRDINKAGVYLEKSAYYGYAAYGCWGTAIILSGSAAIVKTSNAKVLGVSSLILGASGLVCGLISLDYKLKSGRILKLTSGTSDASVAITF